MEILLDGEPMRRIHRSIFGKNPKFTPDDQDFEAWFLPIEEKAALRYCMWRLSSSSLSSFELSKALKERFVSGGAADFAIAELQRMGALDDEAWIERFVEGQRAKLGDRGILDKLWAKGVPKERVLPYLQGDSSEELRVLVAKKYGSWDFRDPKVRNRAIRALLRRGFEFSEVMGAIKQWE